MANNMIELVASLDTAKSVEQIKNDIGKLATQLAIQKITLPIQCSVDTSNIKALQTQLNGIANNLKLNVGVNAQTVNKQGNITTTEIKVNSKNAESQITELSKIVQEQLGNKVHAVLDDLVSGLKTTLGESSTIWTNWTKEADGALSKFSISVKNAKGELTQLNYLVGKNGEIFLANSTGTDKGRIQQQKEILSLTKKISDLQTKNKGNFSASFNDEIVTFKSLNEELENLKKGEGNIENINAKLTALSNKIETIKASVRGAQGKSLNVFDNANINAKKFDNTLKEIDVDIKNLNGFKYTKKSTDIKSVEDLREDYNSLKKTINELNKVEQSQRDNKWYEDYVTASEKLRQLQSDIKLLNKLKKEDNSSGTIKQLEGLAKIQNGYREIQKLEKQRYSAGQNELNYINQLKGGYQRSINAAKNKLEKEGLLTKEIQKQIDAEEAALKKVTERVRRKELDKQVTKEQTALEREQNNKRSQYMSDITSAYSRMNSEYSKLYSSKSSEDEKKAAQERINWNQEIINKSIQALETENIITQRNRDRIAQLKEINLQKQEAASLDSINKQELEDEKVALSAINKIYSERSKQFKILFSSSAPESDKILAQEQLDELTTRLARIKEAFTEEGKINERIKDRIELRSEELQKELKQLNIKKQNEQAEQKAAQEQAKLNAESKDLNNKVQQYVSGLQKLSKLYVKINSADTSFKSETDRNKAISEYRELAIQTHRIKLQINQADKILTEEQKKQINDSKSKLENSIRYVQNLNKEVAVSKEIENINKQIEEEAKRIKKEDEDVANTITLIEKGYERLSKLYKDMTSPTKNTFDKDEAAIKHNNLQSQLSELSKIALANDRISKEQIKQIDNAKAQYQAEESRRNQYIQRLADEQKESSIKKANAETEKRNAKELNDLVNQYVQGYAKLKTLYDDRVSATTDKERSSSAEKYATLKGTLIYLEDILSTNDKISAKQREQIANSKAEFQNHVIIEAQEKKEAEVVKEIASQTQTAKSAISELDKIINNSRKVLKSKDALTTSIGSTNTIENLRTEFERTIVEAKNLRTECKDTLETINKANSVTTLQQTDESLSVASLLLDDIKSKAKDTQIIFEQLKVIADAWKKIESYNSKLSSGNLSTEDIARYNKLIEEQEKVAIRARQEIEKTELHTDKIGKQINDIKSQSESIIKSRQESQKSSEQETKNAEILKTNLKTIGQSYKEIAGYFRIIDSLEKSDQDKTIARKRAKEEYEKLNAAREVLKTQGLLNDEVNKEIQQGRKKIKQAREEVSILNEGILKRQQDDYNNQQIQKLKQQEAEYKKLTQTINGYINALSSFNNSNLAIKNNNDSRVSTQVATNNNLLSQLNTFSQSLKSDNSATNISKISTAIENLTKDLQQATDSSKQLNQALKSENTEARFARNLQTITNRVEFFAATNRKAITSMKTMRNGMTFADEWNRIVTTLRSGNLDGSAIEKLTADFKNFKSEADAAGMTTSRFFNSMNSQLKMVLQRWVSLYAVIGYIRKMIDNVKELDTAMINLKRVTSGTTEEYENFINKANVQAKVLRTTTSSLTEQAYQWAKLGYDMNDALDLSEASTIFTKVADIDESQAINNMITALKAFNMTAEQSMDVVDKLDILNNKYAVSAAGLGEGLERAASSLALTGNSLEQTLAMLTGASEITQNVENTANGIRILSLRLQGMKGKLEELDEPVDDLMEVSKVQTQILNLTKNQVNIFEDGTDKFRSTYDIVKDIAEIWDTLSDTSRASLTEIMFGKNRANVGLALIQSFQSGQTQRAFEDATNAAGTATEEYAEMMDGITAATNAFKQAFESLSDTVIKSDFLKGVINAGAKILEIIDASSEFFGTLPTLLAPLATIFSFKTGNSIIASFSAFIEARKQHSTSVAEDTAQENANTIATQTNTNAETQNTVATDANTGATQANGNAHRTLGSVMKSTASTAKALGSALATGLAISVITIGISKLIEYFQKANKEAEEARQSAIENARAYEEEREKLDSLMSQYTSIITTTDDIASAKEKLKSVQDTLTQSYKDEAEAIDLVNNSLGENLAAQQRLEVQKSQKYVDENTSAYNKAKEALDSVAVVDANGHRLTDNARGLNMKGTKRFSDEVYNEFLNLGLPHFHSTQLTSNTKDFFLSGTLETQLETAKKIRDAYANLNEETKKTEGRYYNERLAQLEKFVADMQKEYDENIRIVTEYEAALKTISDEGLNIPEVEEGLNQVADLYMQFKQAVSDGRYADAFGFKESIESLKKEIYENLDVGSDSYNKVRNFFETIQLDAENTGNSVTAAMKDFSDFAKGVFDGQLESIDKIDNAIKTITDEKGIKHKDAWEIFDLDTEGILTDIQVIDGKYRISTEQLIQLRNKLIEKTKEETKEQEKQMSTQLQNAKRQLRDAQEELARLKKSVNSYGDYQTLQKQEEKIKSLENDVKQYNNAWQKTSLMMTTLNQRAAGIENTVTAIEKETEKIDAQIKSINNSIKGIQSEISELEKESEGLLKAQEAVIDGIVDKYETEKEEIEKSKSELEEQLSVLEEQEEELKNIIEDYKTVGNVVDSTIEKQVSQIEDSRQSVEEYYDNLIDKLKTENEERSDALEYAEKLHNLENAQKNKTMTYSAARGWTYETDITAVRAAQKELDDFKNEQQIKELEKQKENALKPYDQQIKEFQDYAKKWKDVMSEITDIEDEKLAEDILGSEWRTAIETKDEELLEKYRKEYTNFNDKLKKLTNTEVSQLKNAISEREKHIKSLDNEIKKWNDYKSQVTKVAENIKNGLESYNRYLSTVKINENSTLDERERNIKDFANAYGNAINSLTSKQQELEKLQDTLQELNDTKVDLEANADDLEKAADKLKEAANAISGTMFNSMRDIGGVMSGVFDRFAESMQRISDSYRDISADVQNTVERAKNGLGDIRNAIGNLFSGHSHANGSNVNYTGLAMLHGSETKNEVIFNSKDAKKLYEYVHTTPDLIADALRSTPKTTAIRTTNNNTGSGITIQQMTVVADNPTQFKEQFRREMSDFINISFTASKVK